MSYWTQTLTYYSALRALGVDVDVIHADADLSGYMVIVAPAITLVSGERAAHWTSVVEAGARLVCGPRTAFRTPGGETWADGQFGPLSELVGARLLQYDSLRPTLSQKITGDNGDFEALAWAESYRTQGAETLYTYAGGPLDGQSAVIRRGNVTVIGAHSAKLVGTVLAGVLADADVTVTPLPDGVRLSRRAGRTLLQNWNPDAVTWNGQTLAPVSFTVLQDAGQEERNA